MILKNRNRFECLQNSIILVYYFWKSFCNRRINKSNFTIVWRTSFVLHTNQREKTSFYTFWLMIKTFYMTSCFENFAMISKFIIAMQYNFHMSYVNRANQFRNELTISRFEQVKWSKKKWFNTWWIRSIRTHTSFKIIINHKKILIIEINVCLLKNWLKNFYEIQISYINRQSVSNQFIVNEVIVRSILARNFENVKHSFFEIWIYNIVQIVKCLIIVWFVKRVYACHMNISRAIMNRRKYNTNSLINSEFVNVWKHLRMFWWFQMNFEYNHIFNYWMFIYYRISSQNYTHIHVNLMK